MDENPHVKTEQLAAISLKLPPFWPHVPIIWFAQVPIWFAQVEAQFQTRQITQQLTKFSYVVLSLQPEIAQEVRDLLISPPSADPYDKLKTELTRAVCSFAKRNTELFRPKLFFSSKF